MDIEAFKATVSVTLSSFMCRQHVGLLKGSSGRGMVHIRLLQNSKLNCFFFFFLTGQISCNQHLQSPHVDWTPERLASGSNQKSSGVHIRFPPCTRMLCSIKTGKWKILRGSLFPPFSGIFVSHHLYLKVHHLLVQRRFCSLYLLDPLEGDKQQNMALTENSTGH